MPTEFKVETRFVMSKRFPPGTTLLDCGRYKLKAIRSSRSDQGEAVLQFSDDCGSGGGSNPEDEANILCNLLSLILEMHIRRAGLRLNAVDIPLAESDKVYKRYLGHLDPGNAHDYLARVLCLPTDLARQVARACRAYRTAIEFIPSDPTFAFFLFVVAVECLSSQKAIIAASGLKRDMKCERFCLFIERFAPRGSSGDEGDAALFHSLLKSVYYAHRSAFVHGGKEVPLTSLMADNIGSSYFKHVDEGKEVKTPGLDWFAGTARAAMLGYIGSIQTTQADPGLLARLAQEKDVVQLKMKKELRAGQVVTFEDVDYG